MTPRPDVQGGRQHMARYTVRRLLALLPLALFVATTMFVLLQLVPGDPAVTLAGDNASPARIQEVRDNLGLSDPFAMQYLGFIGDFVTFDYGRSLYSGAEVTPIVKDALWVTLSLVTVSLALAALVGAPLGLAAAIKKGKAIDRIASGFSTVILSIPSFVIGVLLAAYVAVKWELLPPTGYIPIGESPWQWLRHLLLPAAALAALPAAELTRLVRAAMLDAMEQDYVRTAQAKGLSKARVFVQHAGRNAAVPVVTVFGLYFSRLIGGAVIIESIFNLPGLGQVVFRAAQGQDLPVLSAAVLISTLLIALANLLIDLFIGYLNPRTIAQGVL